MRVRVHAGRDAQLHVRRGQTFCMQRVETVEFVEAVDDDVVHSGRDRVPELVERLVVAVQDATTCRDARSNRREELAPGGDVEQQAFLVRETRHCPAQERLRGVHDPVRAEFGNRLAAAAAQVRLVVDEQRGSELGRKIRDAHTTDAESTVRRHLGGVGQQTTLESGHICSGALIPSRSNPQDMTRAVMSQRCRREFRTDSSSAFSTGQCS